MYQVRPPEQTPVTLSQAKTHLRVTHQEEDDYIRSCIETATAMIDGHGLLGGAMIAQDWSLDIRDITSGDVCIPIGPVQSVIALEAINTGGERVLLDAADIILVRADDHFYLRKLSGGLVFDASRADGLRAILRCGYGESPKDIPAPLQQAVLLLTAHFYEIREPVLIGVTASKVPISVQSLIAAYKTRYYA